MPECTMCGEPSVISVNGMESCNEHLVRTLDFLVEVMAIEKGLPIDDVKLAVARMLREAMGDD